MPRYSCEQHIVEVYLRVEWRRRVIIPLCLQKCYLGELSVGVSSPSLDSALNRLLQIYEEDVTVQLYLYI